MQFPRYRTIKRIYGAILLFTLFALYSKRARYGIVGAGALLLAVVIGGVISFKADEQDGII